MQITKKLYLKNREDWRKWLKKNFQKEKEIWLVYYNSRSKKKSIPYDDAVEEALCFGWIDSTVKKCDSESCAQRFTLRRKNSVLSELNKERIRKMIRQKKMNSHGLKAVSHVFKENEKFIIPKDILLYIKQDKEIWKNFQNFPRSYKRIRIGYIEQQRSHGKENFEKSLNNFLKKTKQNKMFGTIV